MSKKNRLKNKKTKLSKNDNSKTIMTLTRSDSIDSWFQAYDLIKKMTPENIKTFESFDSYFGIEKYGFFIVNFLYDFDEELYNEGLDDLNKMLKRAEMAKWVHNHFSEEDELNLGNFRNYEAESLWIIGKRDKAKKIFEDTIEIFPNFAYGYIYYGDQYWLSDWSYQHGADYERAEAIYRMALENPQIDHYGDVEERMEDLTKEKMNPEDRVHIAKIRLQLIQKRIGIA
jgi:tetratricopeptide (TPR) repeat protein